MILEVLYHHPKPVAAIIACVTGLLIGIVLFIATSILNVTHKVKNIQVAVFYAISILIIIASIWSLIFALK